MTSDSQTTGTEATLDARLAAAHRTAQMIVLAIAFSITIYLVVGLLLLGAVRPEKEPLQLRIPFYVAALFLSLGSIAFRRTQLRWEKLQAVAGAQGVAGTIRHMVNTTIISAAIAEAIGIISLLMAIFGGDRNDVVISALIGLMIALSSYPRRSAWERTLNYLAQTTPGPEAE